MAVDVSDLKKPRMSAKLPGPVLLPEMYEHVLQVCKDTGLNQSEFVRGAVEFFLAEKFGKRELKFMKNEKKRGEEKSSKSHCLRGQVQTEMQKPQAD